jgi:hypothetical protein
VLWQQKNWIFWGKYCFYSVNLKKNKIQNFWTKNLTTFQNHNFYYEIQHPFLSSSCLKKKEIKRPMVPSFCGVFVIVLAFVRPIMLVLLQVKLLPIYIWLWF